MRRFVAKLIFYFQLRRFIRSGRPKFKRWIELEELKETFIRAAEEGDFPDALIGLLSAALGVPKHHLEYIDWRKLFGATNDIFIHNLPLITLPLLTETTDTKSKRDAWDYPDRMWYLYSHVIAKAYGWTFDTISQLKVEDAIAIIQEILTDEQLDREFWWGLSDRSYAYDPQTRKYNFVELSRPYWMKPKIEAAVKGIPKIVFPKEMLPVGVVNYDAVDEATRPRDISDPQEPVPTGHVEAL